MSNLTKKLIGLVLWLFALLLPFKYAILDTDDVKLDDGRADNITGLLAFVAFIVLAFAGYMFYDGGASKKPVADDGHSGHGH